MNVFPFHYFHSPVNRIAWIFALCITTVFPKHAAAAALQTGLQFTPFFDSTMAPFHEPIWFGEFPAQKGSYMVGELGGNLILIEPLAGRFHPSRFDSIPVAEFSGNDGLLGIAFHPDFIKNRKYYVYYILKIGEAVLEERHADPSFKVKSGASRILLRNVFKNVVHNGGDIHFGVDGLLYIGIGDAGNPMVYNTRGQDLHLLAGKMLRIDVNHADANLEYAIPLDNPFVHSADTLVRKEIYAYGLRQPWRWSFDVADGRLMVGDVGDWVHEEVDVVTKGGNYGWSVMEGNTCFNGVNELSPLTHCDTTGLIAPIAVLPHEPISTAPTACIIGGYVFRGNATSPFFGAYIFGDLITRKVYALSVANNVPPVVTVLGTAPSPMSSFGMDSDGNIFLVGYSSGLIYRLDHPDLSGKGLAIRNITPGSTPMAKMPPRLGNQWWMDERTFMGLTELHILSMDGSVLKSISKAELSQGIGVSLPSGLYIGQSASQGKLKSFPLLLN